MLSNDEFIAWTEKHGLSEAAIELIKTIRSSEPCRAVGGGSKNVIGRYPSQKMGKTIQFESHTVELSCIYFKEHDDSILEYYDQPCQIKLSYKAGKTEKIVGIYHTPDFFVMGEDGVGWEEWKNEEKLTELSIQAPNRYLKIDGVWHCPPGEAYAQTYGLHYWLRSSDEINRILERNFVFLEDYYLENKADASIETKDEVISLVIENPGILLINLINMTKDKADLIYSLLIGDEIFIDMQQEFLSQPDKCHVYLNREIALANKAVSYSNESIKFEDCVIDTTPGKVVLWDGNKWTIVNDGDNYVSLSINGGVTEIEWKQFKRLVSEGRIKSPDGQFIDNTQKEKADRMIREASKQDLAEANRRYKIILPYLEDGTLIKTRTIREWVKNYKQAEQAYGCGYIGLVRHDKNKGNRTPRLSEKVITEFHSFMKDNETPIDPSKRSLYMKFVTQCERKSLIPPSDKTFFKMINDMPKYDRLLKTQGSRIAYKEELFYVAPDMAMSRHGDRAFEVAHIDHTEMDLQTVHSKTLKKHGKFWVSVMFDSFTRRVLAFYITYQDPSIVSDMMVIRECVRRFNRLPQIVTTDNGRDFDSVYFDSLLAQFGVTHKFRPAHKARFGSLIERYLGTTMTQLVHNLRGNTKIMKHTRQVTKYVNPENWAVWTLPEIYNLLTEYFYEVYDTMEHSELGESPREAFERSMLYSGNRSARFIPYNEMFMIITMPGINRNNSTVQVGLNGVVKANYINYYSPELRPLADTRVPIRYDPWNMGIVYCYARNRWVKCISTLNIFMDRSEMELKIASEELLKQKQLFAQNRNITARKLANLLERAEQTEKMLVQRSHDEDTIPELKVINSGIDMKPSNTQQIYPFRMDRKTEDNPYYAEDLEEIMKSFIISDKDFEPKKE